MGLEMKMDPTTTRAAIIGILLFLQGVAIPTLTHILSEKEFPDPVEFTGYTIAAMLILITYMLTFLKYTPEPTTTETKAPT